MHKAAWCVLAILISGCAPDTEDIFPQDGPKMVDIYDQALKSSGRGDDDPWDGARALAASQARLDDVSDYTRTAKNEIDNLFPTLANPDLVMYVFPHLTSDERLPVPGYATSFPLFERPEFALPGEDAAPSKLGPTSKIRIISGDTGSSLIRTF
jgi:conjugative transfer region lipoprotein (TIGR03751 family)